MSTRVGYTGGTAKDPTYRSVCGGDGHTEAMQIVFNPAEVSYDTLLDVFFSEHMPIRKSKPQYKSAVWTHNEEQSKTIKSKIKSIEAAKGLKIMTDIENAKEWYDAEEYHQKYIEKQTTRRW